MCETYLKLCFNKTSDTITKLRSQLHNKTEAMHRLHN